MKKLKNKKKLKHIFMRNIEYAKAAFNPKVKFQTPFLNLCNINNLLVTKQCKS